MRIIDVPCFSDDFPGFSQITRGSDNQGFPSHRVLDEVTSKNCGLRVPNPIYQGLLGGVLGSVPGFSENVEAGSLGFLGFLVAANLVYAEDSLENAKVLEEIQRKYYKISDL